MRNCLRNIRPIVLLLPLASGIALKGPYSRENFPGRTDAPISISRADAAASIKALEKADHAVQVRVMESYARLPLSFEANRGQMDSDVKFFSRGNGYCIFMTPTEAVLTLGGGSSPQPKGPKLRESILALDPSVVAARPRRTAVLRVKLAGANPKPQLTGEDELPGKVNYFIGNDPRKWRTNIGTYAKVRYREVHPGIDLVHYGNQRQLEYDFVVAPGADPKAIRLGFEGAEKMEIDARGDLLLHTPEGDVRQHKPLIYQESDGTRTEVSGGYSLSRRNQVSFEVGKYDRGRPLIIDPTLSYSTYLGGSGSDVGNAIAVDSARNAYVTGATGSTDFPIASPFQAAIGGSSDAFVTKLNATGSALVYSTYLGGSSSDYGLGIAVDSAGNAYVVGDTDSTNFPTANPFQAAIGGSSDVFVTKLNATGSGLVYSTYLGGSGGDYGLGIAADSAGNAYVVGDTNSTNFPTASPFQAAIGGSYDAFVTKLNATGLALVYSTYLGGNINDVAAGIAVDSAGNAYVTGYTASTNFPTASPFQAAIGGASDAFVTKLNATGLVLLYSTYLGGSSDDVAAGIAVDSAGNAYVAGSAGSTNFPTTSSFQAASGGGVNDAFVTKLNATGSALAYSTYLGGNSYDSAYGIAVDSAGNAYVTGTTLSTNFPTASPIQATHGGGENDAFVTKLNATGSALVYSTYIGGNSYDSAQGIAVDSAGNAYVAGDTESTNFLTASPFQAATGGGSQDAFVTKISITPVPAITGLNPSRRISGGRAFTLTVVGRDFVSGATVRWNGSARPTIFVTASRLWAAISAADIASPGVASVTVFNPPPEGGTSTRVPFTINGN